MTKTGTLKSTLNTIERSINRLYPSYDVNQFYGIYIEFIGSDLTALASGVQSASEFTPNKVFYAKYITGFVTISDTTNSTAATYLSKNAFCTINIYDSKREIFLFSNYIHISNIVGNPNNPYEFRNGLLFEPNTELTISVNPAIAVDYTGTGGFVRDFHFMIHGFTQ